MSLTDAVSKIQKGLNDTYGLVPLNCVFLRGLTYESIFLKQTRCRRYPWF